MDRYAPDADLAFQAFQPFQPLRSVQAPSFILPRDAGEE